MRALHTLNVPASAAGGPAHALTMVTELTPDEPDFEECWSSADVAALLAALRAECAPPAPAASAARVEDLLLTGDPTRRVLRRAVDVGGGAAEGDAAVAALPQEWAASLPKFYASCDALLLTHSFAWAPGGGSAAGAGVTNAAAAPTVTLRTLLTTHVSDTNDTQAVLFGDAPLTLPATASGDDARSACAVSLGGDEQPLSAPALAALPPPARAAIKAARRAQVLLALAACVRRRWVGGVLLLRDVAAPLLLGSAASTAHASLESLTRQMRAAAAAAHLAAPMSHARANARTARAEALEAEGEFRAAAALYKANLDDDLRSPGVLLSPPLMWHYYGLALCRSGDLVAARAAYDAGLAICGTCHLSPDLPEWRETLRTTLLTGLIRVVPLPQRDGVMRRLFSAAVPPPRWGQTTMGISKTEHGIWLEERDSGRRWALVKGEHVDGVQLECVRAMPPRAAGGGDAPANFGAGNDAESARDTPGAREARDGAPTVALPRLRGTCAACGAVRAGLKQCAACGCVEYCGKAVRAWPARMRCAVLPACYPCCCTLLTQACAALCGVLRCASSLQCQTGHWKAHKRACREAVAAAKQQGGA
jgi:hypothetical protein